MKMNFSFRTKLQLLIGGFSALALLAFSTMAIRGHYALDNEKMNLSSAAVDGLIDKVDRNLFERYGDVQAFALSEPARSMDAKRITAFMNDMIPAYAPIYDIMMVVDPKGKVVATNTNDKNGKELKADPLYDKDYSSAEWFKKAINGEIKAGTALIEDLHIDSDIAPLVGTDGKVMNFTAPIVDKKSGKILGVWTNRVSWKDVVENIYKEELQKITKGRISKVFPFLISANGTYLIHPNPDMIFKEAKGLDLNPGVIKHEDTFEDFSGIVFQATADSKGYSIYPGIKWKAILEIPETDSARSFNKALGIFAAIFLIGFNFFLMWFTNKSSLTLEAVLESLTQRFQSINQVCGEFKIYSSKLAEATTQQAAAIEETVASMEEMTSMISQTATNSSSSLDISSQGLEEANKGREVIVKMTNSMGEIQASNSQLQDIVKLIEEIQNKTKVINDIVFETRLLAFNASIEAARAGVHGKGFAVVAEEVGKLASMSGKAADEIRNLLETSTSRVGKVVSSTSERVSQAQGISSDCESTFNSVGSYLDRISNAVKSIASATKEQEVGVRQTNKAMQEMDRATQSTAQSADFLERQSQVLSSNAEELNKNIGILESFVHGAKTSLNTKTFKNNSSSSHQTQNNSKVEEFISKKSQSHSTKQSSHSTPAVKTSTLTEKTIPESQPETSSSSNVVTRGDSRWRKVA